MKQKPLTMTRVALGSLLRKPATVPYPAARKPVYLATRGHIAIEEDKCNLCLICDRRCPTGAIAVDRTGKTWAIDRLRCIQCNHCVDVCPRKCLAMENDYTTPMQMKRIDVVPVPFTPPQPKPKPAAAPAPTSDSPLQAKEERPGERNHEPPDRSSAD
ncbi:MAG: 4Fe-4S binding protein [Kiritimatiellae bacterium]|nr:4Fe-4S binding protein [Kiritimatiellia bacterium]